MPRILVGECIHEISSFNPVPGRYEDFLIARGNDMYDRHRGVMSEVSGALETFRQHGDVTIVPGLSARGITSGGTVARADFERLASEFLEAVDAAGSVDAVYFAMHGAIAAEGQEDVTGYLLAETRRRLGERIPIIISLDLHGILTPEMVRHSDALVVYHTYPHVDFFTTGQRAARLLLRILEGNVRPVTAVTPIPALVRGDELITETGRFGECIRAAQAIESSPGGLSAGMFIGNPFTDVSHLQSYSVVVTDGDEERARAESERIANLFWSHHEAMRVPLTSLSESVRIAKSTTGGTVVLMDAADATSSGASGDSNAILCELAAAGYRGRALIPIVDAPAVVRAQSAGVGQLVTTTVGGALDRRRFQPLPIVARVKMLSDGDCLSESNGQLWNAGPTAILEWENVTLAVTSRPVHLYDRSLFFAHGLDPRRFDLVVVKSPHCQKHMFAEWCQRLVNVDAPGSTSADVRQLGHQHCPRPIFPLDPEVSFTARAKLYTRSANR